MHGKAGSAYNILVVKLEVRRSVGLKDNIEKN
jgi:hypothetical protein